MKLALPGFRDLSWKGIRETFRTFRPALRGQGPGLAATFGLTVAVVGLELLRPWPVKVLFDRVLLPQEAGTASGGLSPRTVILATAGATLLLSLLHAAVSVRATIAAAHVSKKVTVRIRRQVFEHLHRLALPFHQGARSGDLLMRLMGDVNAVRDALFASWIGLISRGLLFVSIAGLMIVLEPWLAALALWPMPLLAVQLGRSSRKLRDVAKKQRRKEGGAASFAAETLRQIRLVKAYATEDSSTQLFAQESRSGERAGMKAARIAAHMDRATEVLTGLGLAMVLFVGAGWVLTGRLSAGSLLVFLSYTRSLYKPVRKASGQGARLSRAVACAGRLMEVLRVAPEDFTGGRPAPAFHGHVELRDVRYVHPGGVEALRGASLALPAGDLAVVRGPNGSGKSTLLLMLLRLIHPDAGEVILDGELVDEFQLQSYRGRFAYVPQDIQLFGATVRENILYGRPDANPEEVEEAARVALLHEVVERLPDGYDTTLGEAGATLSGGEGRRLMLARAALRDASILLLDEPLTGLDQRARAVVAQAIRGIAAGRTTIMVSHGPAAEVGPDLIVHMLDGRVKRLERPDAPVTDEAAPGDGGAGVRRDRMASGAQTVGR
jgi:ATP-binding cassette subfamily B protein